MRELNGADSSDGWDPRPFRVLMCDRYEPEIRFDARIPAAIGPHDAMSQARDLYPECSALEAREAS